MKEVITLQFGHYANFVGAHWWNLLYSDLCMKNEVSRKKPDANYETEPEAYFHDGGTKPRAVCFDVKECIGALSESGQFAEENSKKETRDSDGVWHGSTEVTNRLTTYPKPNAESDDSQVKTWSDYLKCRLHSKSLVLMPSASAQDDTDLRQDLGSWTVNARVVCDEIEDRIRYFAEGCDLLEGFHLLTTVHDGCSQLSMEMLNYLSDDFARKSFLLAPVEPARLINGTGAVSAPIQRIVNWAKFLPSAWSDCSLLTPLCLSAHSLWQPLHADDCQYKTIDIPGISYQADLSYHSAAILAVALDSVTLPYRLSPVRNAAYSPRLGMAEYFSTGSKYLKLNQVIMASPYPLRQPPGLVSAPPPHIEPVSVSWTPVTAPLVQSPDSAPETNSNARLLSRLAILRGAEAVTFTDPTRWNLDSSPELRRHVFGLVERDFKAALDASLPVVDSFVRTNSTLASTCLSMQKPVFQNIKSLGAALVSSGAHSGQFIDQLRQSCVGLPRSIKGNSILPESTEWAEQIEWLVDHAQHALSMK